MRLSVPPENCHPEKQLSGMKEHYRDDYFALVCGTPQKRKHRRMSSLAVNPLMPNLIAKPNLIERTHYSAPSSGGIHHSHHSHSSKGGSKHSIALTALTLLSFLFFLNILQNCIQEHMDQMNTTQPQVMVVLQSRNQEMREVQAQKRKGEEEYLNATMVQEPRIDTQKPQERYTQVPVKLRTSEKAVKP